MSLSVILSVLDQTSAQIRSALASLQAQTAVIDEIVVLDLNIDMGIISNNLQDDIAHIPDLTYVQIQPNEKEIYFRNLMLDRVSGEYIAFMDANETWKTDKVEKQLAALQEQQNVVAVYCDGMQSLLNGEIRKNVNCFDQTTADCATWLARNPVRTMGQVIYQRKALLEIHGFRKEMDGLSDLDALCRIMQLGQVIRQEENLLNVQIQQNRLHWIRQFFSQKQLLTDELYLDMMLGDGKVCHDTYQRLAVLASRGKLPVEAVEYYLIGLMKNPIRTLKTSCGWIGTRLKTKARKYNMNRVCSGWTRRMKRELSEGGSIRSHIREGAKDPLISGKEGLESLFSEARRRLYVKSFACVGSAFDGEIVIPEGIDAIGKGAFAGCHHLKRIVFPDSVTRIEDGALMDCTELSEILFSRNAKLSRIGKNVFAGCTSLQEISLPDSLPALAEGLFAGCSSLRKISFMTGRESRHDGEIYERIREIPDYCFAGCDTLESMYFGRGSMLERIGKNAFSHCGNLKLIEIDSRLSHIGSRAFESCNDLTEIVMDNTQTLTKIGKEAFMNCFNLKQFPLSPNLTLVGRGTFRNCRNLQSMRVPMSVRRVRTEAFSGCAALMSCMVENRFTRVEHGAFDKHTRLLHPAEEN